MCGVSTSLWHKQARYSSISRPSSRERREERESGEREAHGLHTLLVVAGQMAVAARGTHEAAAGDIAAVLSQLKLHIDQVSVRHQRGYKTAFDRWPNGRSKKNERYRSHFAEK